MAQSKSWKLITKQEQDDIEFLKEQDLIWRSVANYENNSDYIKIINQIYKLSTEARIKSEKELVYLEKKDGKEVSELSLKEIIDTFNFYKSATGNLVWYYQSKLPDEYGNREWFSIKKETLLSQFYEIGVFIRGGNGERDYSAFNEFNRLLVDRGRYFNKIIQSYTKNTGNGLLNIMNRNFCIPDKNNLSDYHWFLDVIFESLSGGLKNSDCFNHLQEIIFGKYLHPENIFIPCVFINDQGSTGKGMFGARFLQTLFQGNVADNCNIEHLTGKFNKAIAGKAIIYLNEVSRAKVDVEKVKGFIGSPTFMVEGKFEAAYQCDNTALIISATNSSTGGITLSGQNSDRRYSVFSPLGDIYRITREYFKEKEGKEMSINEIKDWVEEIGQYILSDSIQVGKWIYCMIDKFGDLKHVRAKHNDAYENLLQRQRAGWLKTVHDVFTDPGFVYIREQLMRELIFNYNKSEKYIPGRNTMEEEIIQYCKDKEIPVELVSRAYVKDCSGITSQKTIWRSSKLEVKTVNENEKLYGERNSNGNWIWNWEG